MSCVICYGNLSFKLLFDLHDFSWRGPAEAGGVDGDGWPFVLCRLDVFLDQFGGDTDDVLTLPILHHVERLQRADDVTLRDTCHVTGQIENKTTNKTFF